MTTPIHPAAAASLWILTTLGCCSITYTPQRADPSPLTSLPRPPLMAKLDLADTFPDGEVIVSNGLHRLNGARNRDGVREMVRLVWPPQPSYRAVSATISLYVDDAAATDAFRFWSGHAQYKQDLTRTRIAGTRGDAVALTPVLRPCNDLQQPEEYFESTLLVQKGQLLIQVDESSGDRFGRSKQEMITRVAEGLRGAFKNRNISADSPEHEPRDRTAATPAPAPPDLPTSRGAGSP
jgi:hypothetical protein